MNDAVRGRVGGHPDLANGLVLRNTAAESLIALVGRRLADPAGLLIANPAPPFPGNPASQPCPADRDCPSAACPGCG